MSAPHSLYHRPAAEQPPGEDQEVPQLIDGHGRSEKMGGHRPPVTRGVMAYAPRTMPITILAPLMAT